MSTSLQSVFGIQPDAPQVVPPSGEGRDFYHIAPVTAVMAYRVNVAVELQTDDPEGLLFKSAMGQWGHSFFLDTEDNALAFCKALPKRPMGERMARHQYDLVWYLAYPAADVINVEDPDDLASRWERTDGVITSDRCVVKGYRSAKSRHLFHMIALPSFVSAAARMLGHDVPEFDLSELRTNNLFTDAEFAALCGSPDAGKAGHEDEPSWDNSVLFNRRAEVWAALGESNPKVQHTGRTGGKYATASVPLDTVLSAVYSSWTTPVWAKVVSVVNPHLSATYDNSEGETRHERLSVITEVYENEAAAIAAARKYAEEEDGELCPRLVGGEAEVIASTDLPPVPQVYLDAAYTPAMFAEEVKKQADANDIVAAKNLAVDVAVIQAWRAALS